MRKIWRGHEYKTSQLHAVSRIQNSFLTVILSVILTMQLLTCLTNLPCSAFQMNFLLAAEINNPISFIYVQRWDVYLVIALIAATLGNILLVCFLVLLFYKRTNHSVISNIQFFFAFASFPLIIPVLNLFYPSFLILSRIGSRNLVTLPPLLLSKLQNSLTLKIDGSFSNVYQYLVPFWIYVSVPLLGFFALAILSIVHLHWSDYDIKSPVIITNGYLLLPHLFLCVFIKLFEILHYPYYYGHSEILMSVLLCLVSTFFCLYCISTSIFLSLFQNLASIFFSVIITFVCFLHLAYGANWPIPSIPVQILIIFSLIEASFLFTNFQFRHLIERTIRFLAVGGMNVRASAQVVPHGTGAADENSYEANSHGYTHRSEDLQLANSEPFPVVEIMAPLSSSSKLVLSLTTLLYFLWILVSYPFMRISGRAYLNSRSHRDRLIQSDQWSRHTHSRADAFSPIISVTNFKRVGNTGAYQMSQAKGDNSQSAPLQFHFTRGTEVISVPLLPRTEYDEHGNYVDLKFTELLHEKQVAKEWRIFETTRRLHNSEQYIRDFQGLNAARNVPVLSFLKMLADFNRLTFLDKILIKSYMRDHNNRRGLSPTKNPGLYFRRLEDVLVVCAYISNFYKYKILHTTFSGQKVFSSSNVLQYCFIREICFVLEAHWSNPYVIALLYYSLLLSICNNRATVAKETGDLLNFGITSTDAENLFQQDICFKRESQEEFVKFVLENKDSLMSHMQTRLDEYLDKLHPFMKKNGNDKGLDEEAAASFDATIEKLHLRILESHVTAISVDEKLMPGSSVIATWTNNMRLLRGKLNPEQNLLRRQRVSKDPRSSSIPGAKSLELQKLFTNAIKTVSSVPRTSALAMFHLAKIHMRSILGSTNEITSDIQLSELAMTQTIVQLFIEIYKEQHNDINFAFLSLCQFHSSFDGVISSFRNIQKRHKHDPIHTILHLMLLVFLPLVPLDSYHYRRLLDKYKNTNLVISNDGTPFYIKHNVNKVTIYRSYEVLAKFCSLKKFSRILYPLFANDRTVYDDRFIVESSLRIGTAETRPLVGKDAQFIFNVPGTVCKRVLAGLDKERGKIKKYASNIDQLNEMKRLRTITTVQNSRFIKKNPVTNAIYLSVTRVEYLDALVNTWGNKARSAIKLITQKRSFIPWKVIEGLIYLIVISIFFSLIFITPLRQLDGLATFLGNLDRHIKTIDKIHSMLVGISHLPDNYIRPLNSFFKELKDAINNVNAYYPHWNPSVPMYNTHVYTRVPRYMDTWTASTLPVYIQKQIFDLIKAYPSHGQNLSYYKGEFSKLVEPLHQYSDYFLKHSDPLLPLDTTRLNASVRVQLIMWLLAILVIVFAYRMQVTFNQMRRDYTILLHLFIKLPVEIRKEVASYWISHNISRLRLADIFHRNLPAYCEGLLRDIKRLNNVETNPSKLDLEVLQGTRTNSDRYSRRMQMLLKKYISTMDDEVNDTAQMSATIAKYIRIQQRHKQILDIAIAQQDNRPEERLDDGTVAPTDLEVGTHLSTTQVGTGSRLPNFLPTQRLATCSQTESSKYSSTTKAPLTRNSATKKQWPRVSQENKWNVILYDIWRPMVLRKSFLSREFKKCNTELYYLYTRMSARSSSFECQPFLEPLSRQKRRDRRMRQSELGYAQNSRLHHTMVNKDDMTHVTETSDTSDSYLQAIRDDVADGSPQDLHLEPMCGPTSMFSIKSKELANPNSLSNKIKDRTLQSTQLTMHKTKTPCYDSLAHDRGLLDSQVHTRLEDPKDKRWSLLACKKKHRCLKEEKTSRWKLSSKDTLDWSTWRKRHLLFVFVGILIFCLFSIMQILGYIYIQSFSSVLYSMQRANLKSGYLAEKLSALSLDELHGHIAHNYAITLDDRLYSQYSTLLAGPTVHDMISEIFVDTELMQARSWLFSTLLREIEAAVSELRRLNTIGVFLAHLSQYKSNELVDLVQPTNPRFKPHDFLTDYVYLYNNYNMSAELSDPDSIRSQLSKAVMDADFEEQIYGYNILNQTQPSYTDLMSDVINSDADMRRAMSLGTFNSLYYYKVVYAVRKLSRALMLEMLRLQTISFLDETVDGRDFYLLYFKRFIKSSIISNLGQRNVFMNIFYHGNTFVNPVSLTHKYISKHHTDSYQRIILQPFVHFNLTDGSTDTALQKILSMKLVDVEDSSGNIDTYIIRQFMIYITIFIAIACISYCSFFLIFKYLYQIKFKKFLIFSLVLLGLSLFLLIVSFIYLIVKVASTRDLTNFNRFVAVITPAVSIRNWILDIALKSKHLTSACLDVENLMHSTPPQNASAFTFQTLDRLAGSLSIAMEKGLALEQGGYDPLYPDPHVYYFDRYLRQNSEVYMTDEKLILNYELNNGTLDSRAARSILESRVKKISAASRRRQRHMDFITGPNGNAYAVMNELMLLLPEQLAIPYYNAILYANSLESQRFLTWLRAEIPKRTGKSLSETHFLQDMVQPGSTHTNILYYYKRPAVTRFAQHSHLLSLNTLSQGMIRYLGATRRALGYYCLWREKTLAKSPTSQDPIVNPFVEILENLEEITPSGVLYALRAPRKFVKDMIDFNEPTNPQSDQIEHNPYRYQFSPLSVDPMPHLSGYPYTSSDLIPHNLVAFISYNQQISKYHLDNYVELIELLNTIMFSNLEQAAQKHNAWVERSGLTVGLFTIGPYIFGLGIICCVIVIMEYLTTTFSVLFPFLAKNDAMIDQLRPELLFKQRKCYSVMITIRRILLILMAVLFVVISLFLVYYTNLLLYIEKLLYVITRLVHDTSMTRSKLLKVLACMTSSSDECRLVDLSLRLKELRSSADELFYSMSFLELNKGLQIPYISATWLNQSLASQRNFRQKKLFLDSASIYPVVGGSLTFDTHVYRAFHDTTNILSISFQYEAIRDLAMLYWAIQQGDIYTALLSSIFKEAHALWSVDYSSSQVYLNELVTSGLTNPLYRSIASYLDDNRIDFFQLASTLNITITNKDRYDIYREIYQKTVNKFSTIFDIESLTARNVNWTQYIYNISVFSHDSKIQEILDADRQELGNYSLPSIIRILSIFHRDMMSMYNSVLRDDNTALYTDFISESILYQHKSTSKVKDDMQKKDALYNSILQCIVNTGELEILLGLYQQELQSVLLDRLRTNAFWIDILISSLCIMVVGLFLAYLPLLRITRDIKFIASILRMIPHDKFKRLNAYYSLLLYEK